MSGEFLPDAARRYWKHTLWLTAGLTLVALVAVNVMVVPEYITPIVLAVLFSLVSGVAMSMVIRRVVTTLQPGIGKFLAYASVRLLLALALIVGYMWVTGLRGRQLLPFVIIFSTYFILHDALDAWYMMRVQKALNNEQ